MKISELLQKRAEPFYSFEYFPPRTEDGVKNLYQRLERMSKVGALFADITWGAGGSTSDLTLEIATKMVKEFGFEANMHLTCTNMEVAKIEGALKAAKEAGIQNIVALRGDPPVGQQSWSAVEGGYACALDLVKHIRKEYGDYFCISVAGYPEGHPNVIKKVDDASKLSPSENKRTVMHEGALYVCSDADYQSELAYLKSKIDAGGNLIITQMFFDTDVFIQFVADCRAVGIKCPILPGIMPIQAFGGFKRMTGFCKTRVPQAILDRLEPIQANEEEVRQAGIEIGVDMCRKLLESGAPGLHFYTLNLEKTTYAILETLGMKPKESA